MDYDYVLPFITYRQELEFGCLIPSLIEEINKPQEKKKLIRKKQKCYKRSSKIKKTCEEIRMKNLISAKKSRMKKTLLKESLEKKVVQLRKKYENLFGHKFFFQKSISYKEFKIGPDISKKERIRISARKCRYNKKKHFEQLEEEVGQLQFILM
jgi:hypothetical protein